MGIFCHNKGFSLFSASPPNSLFFRSSGSGGRCVHLIKPIVPSSSSLSPAPARFHCRGLLLWRGWMASRNSKYIGMIDPRIDCPQPTHGELEVIRDLERAKLWACALGLVVSQIRETHGMRIVNAWAFTVILLSHTLSRWNFELELSVI